MKSICKFSFTVVIALLLGFAVNAQNPEDASLKPGKSVAVANNPTVIKTVNREDASIVTTAQTSTSMPTAANAKILKDGDVDPSSGEIIKTPNRVSSTHPAVVVARKTNAAVYPTGKEATRYNVVTHAKHTGATPVIQPTGKEAVRYKTVVHAKHTSATPVVHPDGKEAALKTAKRK